MHGNYGNGPAFCAGADLKSPPGQIVDGQDRAIAYPDALTSLLKAQNRWCGNQWCRFCRRSRVVGAADIVITVDNAQFSLKSDRVIPVVISVVCLPKLGNIMA